MFHVYNMPKYDKTRATKRNFVVVIRLEVKY